MCRRESYYGLRFWLAQRLLEAAHSTLGSVMTGTWGLNAFYRLFGASVGKWTTFRYGNIISVPDMLTAGDW